jgi:hypothetical protein
MFATSVTVGSGQPTIFKGIREENVTIETQKKGFIVIIHLVRMLSNPGLGLTTSVNIIEVNIKRL